MQFDGESSPLVNLELGRFLLDLLSRQFVSAAVDETVKVSIPEGECEKAEKENGNGYGQSFRGPPRRITDNRKVSGLSQDQCHAVKTWQGFVGCPAVAFQDASPGHLNATSIGIGGEIHAGSAGFDSYENIATFEMKRF